MRGLQSAAALVRLYLLPERVLSELLAAVAAQTDLAPLLPLLAVQVAQSVLPWLPFRLLLAERSDQMRTDGFCHHLIL